MIIFFNEEDRNRIFDNGPYFLNSAGLFLRPWKEWFNSDRENLMTTQVWIRMYSLPTEHWKEEILTDIENTLGNFIKVSKKTKQRRYTSYAKICIYLDISQDLPDGIELSWDDEDWFLAIDYEWIPFRCRRCHKHGHLFKYCPQNKIKNKR